MTQSQTDVSGPEQASKPERQVLIVDDDEEFAGLLAHWVETNGTGDTAVTITSSIESSSEVLDTLSSLDVVLLDRRLPKGLGDELLETITGEFDPIVVMITAMEPEDELIRLPITDYLVKPIDESVLVMRLSLLERLEASGVLAEYTNARKAALLEYHLDDPTASPLFRRFAARLDYDRLEVAIDDSDSYVYELYLNDHGTKASVSVIGRLTKPAVDLVEHDVLRQVGEVLPSGDSYAWLDVMGGGSIQSPRGGYAIFEFDHDTPDVFIEPTESRSENRVARALEKAYQ